MIIKDKYVAVNNEYSYKGCYISTTSGLKINCSYSAARNFYSYILKFDGTSVTSFEHSYSLEFVIIISGMLL